MMKLRALAGPGQTIKVFAQPETSMGGCSLSFSKGCEKLYLLKVEGKDYDLPLPASVYHCREYHDASGNGGQAWSKFAADEFLTLTIYNPTNEEIEFQAFVTEVEND